jgi:hypothetical protein
MDPQVFVDIDQSALRPQVESYHARKWRFVNICASTVPEGVELLYSFSDGEPFENLRLVVPNGAELPSVSDLYLNAFYFENETHDLFGVVFKGIAIDFGGKFYDLSVPTPMNPASVQARAAMREQAAGAAQASEGGTDACATGAEAAADSDTGADVSAIATTEHGKGEE